MCRLSDSVREGERLKGQIEDREHEVAALMRRLEVSGAKMDDVPNVFCFLLFFLIKLMLCGNSGTRWGQETPKMPTKEVTFTLNLSTVHSGAVKNKIIQCLWLQSKMRFCIWCNILSSSCNFVVAKQQKDRKLNTAIIIIINNIYH